MNMIETGQFSSMIYNSKHFGDVPCCKRIPNYQSITCDSPLVLPFGSFVYYWNPLCLVPSPSSPAFAERDDQWHFSHRDRHAVSDWNGNPWSASSSSSDAARMQQGVCGETHGFQWFLEHVLEMVDFPHLIMSWLVVSTHLKKCESVGIIIPNIWKVIKAYKNHVPNHQPVLVFWRVTSAKPTFGTFVLLTITEDNSWNRAISRTKIRRVLDRLVSKCWANSPSCVVVVVLWSTFLISLDSISTISQWYLNHNSQSYHYTVVTVVVLVSVVMVVVHTSVMIIIHA